MQLTWPLLHGHIHIDYREMSFIANQLGGHTQELIGALTTILGRSKLFTNVDASSILCFKSSLLDILNFKILYWIQNFSLYISLQYFKRDGKLFAVILHLLNEIKLKDLCQWFCLYSFLLRTAYLHIKIARS